MLMLKEQSRVTSLALSVPLPTKRATLGHGLCTSGHYLRQMQCLDPQDTILTKYKEENCPSQCLCNVLPGVVVLGLDHSTVTSPSQAKKHLSRLSNWLCQADRCPIHLVYAGS